MMTRPLAVLALLAFCAGGALAPSAAEAAEKREAVLTKEARDRLGRIAILDNHRVKPFDTFARETVKTVTGDEDFGGLDPIETVLAWAVHAPEYSKEALVRVKKERVFKEKLGLSPDVERVSFESLEGNEVFNGLFQAARTKDEKERGTVDNQALEVATRFFALEAVFYGRSFQVVPAEGAEPESWYSFVDREHLASPAATGVVDAWKAFLEAYAQGDGARASSLVAPLAETLRAVNPVGYPADTMIGYEVTLNRTKPFFWGAWLYFLAFAVFLGSFIGPPKPFRIVALVISGVAASIHVFGMIYRVLAAERPPVTNIPESLVWISFGVLLFAVVFELIYKIRFFGTVGTALAGLGLLYFNFCPFPTSIGPIPPVLRSNYWLTVHVLTITISYAALLLGGGLGATYIWCRVFNVKSAGIYPTLMKSLFPAIYIGVLLITAGIILGGVWANESWGRYWGWDPKETWAFITLLWFLAIVHARMAGYAWFKGLAVAGATVFGAGLTLFTWWGVNFIPWFVGLHTYAGASAEEFKISSLPIAAQLSAVAVLATLGAAAVKGFLSRGLPKHADPAAIALSSQPSEKAAGPAPSGRPGVRPV